MPPACPRAAPRAAASSSSAPMKLFRDGPDQDRLAERPERVEPLEQREIVRRPSCRSRCRGPRRSPRAPRRPPRAAATAVSRPRPHLAEEVVVPRARPASCGRPLHVHDGEPGAVRRAHARQLGPAGQAGDVVHHVRPERQRGLGDLRLRRVHRHRARRIVEEPLQDGQQARPLLGRRHRPATRAAWTPRRRRGDRPPRRRAPARGARPRPGRGTGRRRQTSRASRSRSP